MKNGGNKTTQEREKMRTKTNSNSDEGQATGLNTQVPTMKDLARYEMYGLDFFTSTGGDSRLICQRYEKLKPSRVNIPPKGIVYSMIRESVPLIIQDVIDKMYYDGGIFAKQKRL